MNASDLYGYLLGTDQFLIQSIELDEEKIGIIIQNLELLRLRDG